MRKLFIAALTLAAPVAGATFEGQAADLSVRRGIVAKAPPLVSPLPVADWRGFYVGVHLGGDWSEIYGDRSSSIIGGFQGGYNLQFNQFVLGAEIDLSLYNPRSTVALPPGLARFEENWLSTYRGRLGYVFDRYMIYGTLGLAVGNVDTSVAGFGSVEHTRAGLAAGLGIEAKLWPRWTGKLEYLYTRFSEKDFEFAPFIIRAEATNSILRAGLNYKLY